MLMRYTLCNILMGVTVCNMHMSTRIRLRSLEPQAFILEYRQILFPSSVLTNYYLLILATTTGTDITSNSTSNVIIELNQKILSVSKLSKWHRCNNSVIE